MKPELKARLERLGPIPGITRVTSGSPADVTVRPADGLYKVQTITAIRALAYRGLPLAVAKRAIEQMVEHGEASVHVPTIESWHAFSADLLAVGVLPSRNSDAKE